MKNKLVLVRAPHRQGDDPVLRLLPVAHAEGQIDQALGGRLEGDLQKQAGRIVSDLERIDALDLQLRIRARLIEAMKIEPQRTSGVNKLHRDGPEKELTRGGGKRAE